MRLPEAGGPSFVSSHCIQETAGGERDWPGLAGGAGIIRSGCRGVPRREQPHFPSLRCLPGGLRARVPRPGPADLCLLPHPVSLPAGRLLSTGPCFPSWDALSSSPMGARCPELSSLPTFCSPLASGTFSSSRFSSPEPSARQPPTRSWKPSPIWAWVRAPGLPTAQMDKLRPRGRGKAKAHSLKPGPFPQLGPLPDPLHPRPKVQPASLS